MIIATKMKLEDFIYECTQPYGWYSGTIMPTNVTIILNRLKKKYGIEYHFVDEPYRNPVVVDKVKVQVPETEYVELHWIVYGELTKLKGIKDGLRNRNSTSIKKVHRTRNK